MRRIKKIVLGFSLFILVVFASKNVFPKHLGITVWSENWDESEIIRF